MRKIGLLAQGQLGNNLFVLAYALHLLKNAKHQVIVFTECEDLNEFYKDTSDFKDGKLIIKKWPKLMKFYMKLRSRIIQKSSKGVLSKLDNLFHVRVFDEPWEVPQENELMRWNVGYFQNVTPAMSVKDELLIIIDGLSIRTFRKSENQTIKVIRKGGPYTAVHFRRGVYRNIPEYGLISTNFVDLESIEQGSSVFVSSDDKGIEHELENWRDKVNYFSISHLSAIEAFVVLAGASKIYLSNSTFAWWAGFFVNLRGGVVICPTPWFKDAKVPKDYLWHPTFDYKTAIFS
jgi:hypothetical protein